MRKRRSCCAALRFSIFPFPCSVCFFFFYSFWQIPSRRCPSGQPAAIFICNYLYGEHLGTELSSTASAGTTGRLAPFNNSRWLSGIHACANGLHKIRRGCNRDCRRCNSHGNSNNQSIVTDICHVSQANFPCCSWPATATWLAFLCNKHVVKMSIAFSGCAGF